MGELGPLRPLVCSPKWPQRGSLAGGLIPTHRGGGKTDPPAGTQRPRDCGTGDRAGRETTFVPRDTVMLRGDTGKAPSAGDPRPLGLGGCCGMGSGVLVPAGFGDFGVCFLIPVSWRLFLRITWQWRRREAAVRGFHLSLPR